MSKFFIRLTSARRMDAKDAKAFVNGCVLGTALWAAIFLILLLLMGCGQQPANGQTYQEEGPATTYELKLLARNGGLRVYEMKYGHLLQTTCIIAQNGSLNGGVAVDCL